MRDATKTFLYNIVSHTYSKRKQLGWIINTAHENDGREHHLLRMEAKIVWRHAAQKARHCLMQLSTCVYVRTLQ
jgi:hypothetical protein